LEFGTKTQEKETRMELSDTMSCDICSFPEIFNNFKNGVDHAEKQRNRKAAEYLPAGHVNNLGSEILHIMQISVGCRKKRGSTYGDQEIPRYAHCALYLV
jgi:hypothetical protein